MTIPFEDPLISPRQMNFLRAVAAMAWADGVLEPQEVTTLADQLAPLFCGDQEICTVQAQVAAFLAQNVPLSETLPRLKDATERALLLKLAYVVIHVSRRKPDEPLVNEAEASAYAQLCQSIDLSPEQIAQAEAEALTYLTVEGYLDEVYTYYQ